LIQLELSSDLAKEVFPEEFRSYLLDSLKYEKVKSKPGADLFHKIKNLIPKTLKRKILKRTFIPKMDISVLSFRAFLILRMVKLLKQ
jgi:isocitrate dehydrogenase kinase/phosphatase